MKCNVCGKKMPKRVLEAHMKKRHLLEGSSDSVSDSTGEKIDKITIANDWDWGEIIECGVCKERWPSKLYRFHIRIEHGI